jgi:hypothetical protein
VIVQFESPMKLYIYLVYRRAREDFSQSPDGAVPV